MPKRLITILIAPLLLIGCGEEPTITRYETSPPAGFDWPATAQREVVHEVDGRQWVWEVPAGWMDAPEVPDQVIADYRFKGSTESLPGRLTVARLDGDAGGINANVMRWLKQLYVTVPQGYGPKDEVSDSMAVGIGQATFVELHGQYQGEHVPTHLYAAIVQIPAEGGGVFQTWVFKLVGDEKTAKAEANRWGLAKMVLSLRPKGTPKLELPDFDEVDTNEQADAPDDAPAQEETPQR